MRVFFLIISFFLFYTELLAQNDVHRAVSEDLVIKPKSLSDSDLKSFNIIEEIPNTKYSKSRSEQNYKQSSKKQKTIYDIHNYGLNSTTPYKVDDYKIGVGDISLDREIKKKETANKSNRFYVTLQSNLLFPNTLNLHEPYFFGKELPTLSSSFSQAYDFLPNGKRSGLYSVMSSNKIIKYPYFSIGIRTNNNFRFELSRSYANIKLQNHKNEKGINTSYINGYTSQTRVVSMNFKQQINMLSSYVDLKLKRAWIYFGAGLGVVNNELNEFMVNIEDNSYRYILEGLVDKKVIYRRATMVSIGMYSEIYKNTFLDIGIKKMSLGKVSTLKDYRLTQIDKISGVTISDIISMNILEAKMDPYLINIGFRIEF